jgi:hypothetical protein
VEKRQSILRKKKRGIYASKIKRAIHLLFFKRHRKPGVKGWELQKALGADYPKVLEVLDDYLKSLDLQVKTVFETEKLPSEKPSLEDLNRARFYVILRGEIAPKELKMIGWRVDDLAGLAVAISFIISKKGQAMRKDIEDLLGEKLPGWKVSLNIDRYIRYGYLQQDDKDQVYLDWRTRAEVNEKALIDSLLKGMETTMPPESSSETKMHNKADTNSREEMQ